MAGRQRRNSGKPAKSQASSGGRGRRGAGSAKGGSGPAKRGAGPAKRGAGPAKRATGPAKRGASAKAKPAQNRNPKSQDSRPQKRGRPKGLGGDHVEGRQAVRELLLAGNRRVHEVLMIEDLDPAGILEDITQLSQEIALSFKLLNRRRFESEALTHSHQGVLARAQPLPEAELDKLALEPGAFLLVLDGVTDPGNLGAMLRTAECAGVTGVVMPKHRAVHITPTAAKNAAGAIEHLPMALVGGIPRAIARLQELGVTTIGLDAGGTEAIYEVPLKADTSVAIVMGAEGTGLSRLASERVDHLAAIPMAGELNSLNVAMASAVACFEVVRKRQLS